MITSGAASSSCSRTCFISASDRSLPGASATCWGNIGPWGVPKAATIFAIFPYSCRLGLMRVCVWIRDVPIVALRQR